MVNVGAVVRMYPVKAEMNSLITFCSIILSRSHGTSSAEQLYQVGLFWHFTLARHRRQEQNASDIGGLARTHLGISP
jgi:hypothetical protein